MRRVGLVNKASLYLRILGDGIRERKVYLKSLGLSYLLVINLFPALLLILGIGGYLITKFNAVVRVNNYLYEILPVEKDYKEAILNNVFIVSEQLTANYLTILISGIICFGLIFYYLTNYLRSSVTDGIEELSNVDLRFRKFSTIVGISFFLFIVSFAMTAIIFDPFSFVKETMGISAGVRIPIFVATLGVSFLLFSLLHQPLFRNLSQGGIIPVLLTVFTFEIFKVFYLYYIFYISRPFRITGIVEIFFITFVMLFYFSFLLYLSVEYRIALMRYRKIKLN
ncbi:MAG: hypothetical protein OZ913_04945 [Ignavibacteriaceae bacterium]|jgi:uncharacterized BrkB/YihY/UPF0761 family membrane protein|nr:MAG: hypothetical protein EDM69_03950 [Chlorobiota bacterium]KXK05924.1 MAG: Ribonuclease BN-like family protein [Chlorobi bacterium OLB4]MBV6398249.1 hypothetical protein [Ignavibacteria bacterium]MCC6886158.1 hypothetical protein [Ignavibacteriales bacterium]MCE7952590.1 hypothetical protein [Chlorobi bacterium CHB7]MDL1886702.1 hypothetical protein [Ignavibacteria bacterium CHB1]MEB2329630.1 hypothetical protein [Ignavibacteriaceae bacterium]OQY77731.1 MAG: hypothetical protein B6D43_0